MPATDDEGTKQGKERKRERMMTNEARNREIYIRG